MTRRMTSTEIAQPVIMLEKQGLLVKGRNCFFRPSGSEEPFVRSVHNIKGSTRTSTSQRSRGDSQIRNGWAGGCGASSHVRNRSLKPINIGSSRVSDV